MVYNGDMKEKKHEEIMPSVQSEESLALRLAKSGSKEASVIEERLVTNRMRAALNCDIEGNGTTMLDNLIANWYKTQMERGVDSRALETAFKLSGESVQRSQRVEIKGTLSSDSTSDFLKGINRDDADERGE